MQFGQVNKTSFIAGVGSAVLLGAALIPAWASGQTAGETPSATPRATATATIESDSTEIECAPGAHFHGRGLLGLLGPHLGEDLAAALGIRVDELKAAAQSAYDSLGEIERPTTAEELEALKGELQAALASALGISVADIEAALEEVQAAKQAALIARIEAAVADGSLTQEQADALIERIEGGERPFPGRRGFAPLRGLDGGFPRGLGGGGGFFFEGTATPGFTPDA